MPSCFACADVYMHAVHRWFTASTDVKAKALLQSSMGQKLVVKNQDGTVTRITVFTQPNKQIQNLLSSMKTGGSKPPEAIASGDDVDKKAACSTAVVPAKTAAASPAVTSNSTQQAASEDSKQPTVDDSVPAQQAEAADDANKKDEDEETESPSGGWSLDVFLSCCFH